MTLGRRENPGTDRRQFIWYAWGAALFGMFGQTGAGLLRFLQPRRVAGAFGTEIVAGQLDEFELGTVSQVTAGRFFVSRLEDGSLLALWQRCPHLGCTVVWRDADGRFRCPCHSSLFDPRGEVISGPAPRPMDIFPVRVVDGRVVVDTGRPMERDRFSASQPTRG